MADTTAVVVDDVTKSFQLRGHRTLRRLVIDGLRGERRVSSFKALERVSFRLEEGDSIGLMGLNGSGKSTLLKLISGVMAPDEGKVWTRGRIAGLIEVGAGFHPELTGRENVFLNGAILGMSEAEINRKFDAIVDFSEMEQFLDTEVRHYSSGMFMRLAFSVAIETDCDIFLMDEMLAVGDQPFKRKCMARIKRLRDEGHTMVFVSHSPRQVINLCEKGIVLEKGRAAFVGTAREAVDYLKYSVDEDTDDE